MIVKPTVTELLRKAKNRYELIIATSRRARQIAMGEKPLTNVDEKSPVTIAANEIAEGKVNIIRDENEDEENDEVANDDETEENKDEEYKMIKIKFWRN